MIKLINTNKGHQPIGPYSQAAVANGFVFVSGTAGVNPKTGKLAKGIAKQTQQAFVNINEVLLSAGSSLSQAVKVTIFLTDMKNFQEMNLTYKKIFNKQLPARTTVAVSELAKSGALIVVELIALVK